jgi:hypothetical protein
MKFPDASGVPVNMLPISDGSVFDHLKQLVETRAYPVSIAQTYRQRFQ